MRAMKRAAAILATACCVALVVATANAIPQPPHDEAGAGITCSACHTPYAGVNNPAESEGAATAGSGKLSLFDDGKSWAAGQWVDGVVTITSGANLGEFRTITASDATSVSWEAALPAAVAPGDEYRIGKTTYFDIETKCKSCHNPTGMASDMWKVGLHIVNGDTVVGCGKCHDPHNVDPNSGQGNALLRDSLRWPGAASLLAWPSGNPDNDYVVGGSPFNGACEACHTETKYHRNNSSADHSHQAGMACVACHAHEDGFAPSMGGGAHGTHLDAPFGPQMGCGGCHGAEDPPLLSDGEDLADTSVCDDCHSPGGTYDGVNDPVFGAKANWDDSVYLDGALKAGKEKWCAGCHDESPSTVGGVAAPNVVGGEGEMTGYGLGWGFYRTGHGLAGDAKYPASGFTTSGAGSSCGDCHDPTGAHVDGEERTFHYQSQVGAPDDYQNGYRLKSVDGGLPMVIPRDDTCFAQGVDPNESKLCFSCHDSGPFIDQGNSQTNFRDGAIGNHHYYHMAIKAVCGYGPTYKSDYGDHGNDSRTTCVTCHNVHGTPQLSMVKQGLEVKYFGDNVSYDCFNYPDPRDVPLTESTGTVWGPNVGAVCSGCHGSCGFDDVYLRSPVLFGQLEEPPAGTLLHPSALDATEECTPQGGGWPAVLAADDGDASHVECNSYFNGAQWTAYPASFSVAMEDSVGLDGADIEEVVVTARVRAEISGGGGPTNVTMVQLCYDTGGADQTCSVWYDLSGLEGYLTLYAGSGKDPSGGAWDASDLDALNVQFTILPEDCCGWAYADAYITEIAAEITHTP